MTWLVQVAAALALVAVPWTVMAEEPKGGDAAAVAGPQATADEETPVAGPGGPGFGGPCPGAGMHGAGRGTMMPGHAMMPGGPGGGTWMPGMRGGREMGMPMGPRGPWGAGPAGPPADPKERGRRMQMRGEMLRAMGDILIRYGKELEAGR